MCKASNTFEFKTWMGETTVVALILGLVAFFTGGQLVQWLQALAVLCTFGYVSVTNRVLEQEEQKDTPGVECHKMAMKYFVAKEILWAVVFLLIKAYPALIGIGIFLLYPVWRKWWRNRHPLRQT
jgi:hypothetical protein